MEKLGSSCTDFHEIWHAITFRKSVKPNQVAINSDNNGCFTWRPMCIHDNMLPKFSWNEKCLRKNLYRKITTHILYSVNFIERRAVCEIMWKNMIQPDRTRDSLIRCMRFGYRINKTTETLAEYVIFIAFRRQQWLHQRSLMLHYRQMTSLVLSVILIFPKHLRNL
jgi:hypothetical protein